MYIYQNSNISVKIIQLSLSPWWGLVCFGFSCQIPSIVGSRPLGCTCPLQAGLLSIKIRSNLNLFTYLDFNVTFSTVQVISWQVVLWAEETSTYSWSRFCTVNCRPSVRKYLCPERWEATVFPLRHWVPPPPPHTQSKLSLKSNMQKLNKCRNILSETIKNQTSHSTKNTISSGNLEI